jgi:hypothetical protein
MQLPTPMILIALPIGLGSCSQEHPGYSEKERVAVLDEKVIDRHHIETSKVGHPAAPLPMGLSREEMRHDGANHSKLARKRISGALAGLNRFASTE